MRVLSGSFVRPANVTAYASGQLVANSTTNTSVVPVTLIDAIGIDDRIMVKRIRLAKNSTGLTAAAFRVHLYVTPTIVPTNGDGGVFLTPIAGYVGYADVTMDVAFSDGAMGAGLPVPAQAQLTIIVPGASRLLALVEARGAYTPVSGETFTVFAATSG